MPSIRQSVSKKLKTGFESGINFKDLSWIFNLINTNSTDQSKSSKQKNKL
jgi:hypothetical protein